MSSDLSFQAVDGIRNTKLHAFPVAEAGEPEARVQIELTTYTATAGNRRQQTIRLSRADACAMGHALLALAECSPIRV